MKLAFIIMAMAAMAMPAYSRTDEAPVRYDFMNITTTEGLSQLSVLTIFQDSRGYMWFGTRDGLNRFDGQKFDHYFHRQDDSTSLSSNYIRCIDEDMNGNIWVGTGFGLNMLNLDTGKFRRYLIDKNQPFGETNHIKVLHINRSSGRIFVGCFSGLYIFDPVADSFSKVEEIKGRVNDIEELGDTVFVGTYSGLWLIARDKVSYYSPFNNDDGSGNSVDMLYADNENKLWLSSYKNGIVRIDTATWERLDFYDFPGNLSIIKNEVRAMSMMQNGCMLLGTNSGLMVYDRIRKCTYSAGHQFTNCPIESLFVDNQGGLWVGTYSEGIGYSHPYIDRFKQHRLPQDKLAAGTTGPMTVYDDILYMGTEGRGLVTYDMIKDTWQSYPCISHSGNTFRDNNVKSMFFSDGAIYIGLYSGWVYVFDIKGRKYIAKYGIPGSPPVYSIIKMGEKILAGTYSSEGIWELRPGFGFVKYRFADTNTGKISQVSALLNSGDGLYIGTKADGLYRYDGKLMHHYVLEDGRYLTGKMISTIKIDKKGNLLVGSYDGGLSILKCNEKFFSRITRDEGLNDDMICSIIEGNDDNIWVITHGGISRLDRNFKVLNTYSQTRDLNIKEFSVSSATMSDEGVIYAGGDNGFVSFRPDNLQNNTSTPPVLVESVIVNNVPYTLSERKGISLSGRRNSLTFRYVTLNYIYPEQNIYACMLEGTKDTSWTFMDNVRSISYANLSPGKYVFKVKGANNDGIWNSAATEIPIHIHPPFWLSWYAFVFYLLIFSLAGTFIVHYLLMRQDLRHQMISKQNEKAFFQARIDMFTKFSHELRTPLMLVQGPVEEVIQTDDTSRMTIDSFKTLNNNLNRMRLLLDQLLAFRKKENESLKINVSEGDFIGFAREIKLSFNSLARLHKIDFRIEEGEVPTDIWYDRSLFERVLMNILSNAFKYTPDGGKIKMSLDYVSGDYASSIGRITPGAYSRKPDRFLRIKIEDTGPGIPEDALEKIFEPFFQVSEEKGGTGIGLALSAEIVRLHHGTLWAENRQEGGALFTVLIPAGREHFNESEITRNYQDSENINRYYKENKDLHTYIKPFKSKTVLIVEDNRELREYMVSVLSGYFKVVQAPDGRQGLIAVKSAMPVLVVSDIMMPVMNGLELCSEIKSDPSLCHIPVILLTARALAIQMHEGLKLGADDYITKPFNVNTLALKISNILSSRENLKNLYAHNLTFKNMGIDVQSSDEKFLLKLNETVASKISDPDLDVGQFCSMLGLSRSSLYRKLQSATGMSPSKYLHTVRLHIAARMLKETSLSIQEIMDATGYVNAAHFSVSFKKKYGMSPSAYRLDEKINLTHPQKETT